jgi:enamine deaminase RidA (YjgF/YER057c/UK114 family)
MALPRRVSAVRAILLPRGNHNEEETAMNEHSNPKQVHPPLGAYSHTVKVPPNATWLILSGQVGVNASGKLQAGMRRQAEQVFRNILACLRANRMRKEDLVKLVVYITDSRLIEEYRAARTKMLGGDVVPASTLLIIDGLAHPDMLIEVEVWAATG